MRDHDTFHVDSDTGWCGYCADTHQVQPAPSVQVFDQAAGVWTYDVQSDRRAA